MLTLRKKGTELVFENEGTAPQDGAINATYSGWRGAIMVALNQLLCWDQYFAIGGALRHVEFDPTPGTLQLRDFPGLGVDRAGAGDGDLALSGLQRAVEDDLQRPGDARGRHVHRRHQPVAGDDLPRHRPVGRALRLHPGRSDRRRDRRLLARRRHLDRRPVAHADLQAAERRAHRADASRCCSCTARKSSIPAARAVVAAVSRPSPASSRTARDAITQDTLSSGNAIPTSTGMMGGYPATMNVYKFKRDTDIRRAHGAARDDRRHRRSEGQRRRRCSCGRRTSCSTRATSMRCSGRRPAASAIRSSATPKRVREDVVENRAVSLRRGARHLRRGDRAPTSALDAEATQTAARQRREADRKTDGAVDASGRDGGRCASPTISKCAWKTDGLHLACAKCAADLGPVHDNYKDHCVRRESRHRHGEPEHRRLSALHRRAAGVPAVLLPRLRRADRERDRARGRSGAARYPIAYAVAPAQAGAQVDDAWRS